MKIRDAIRLVAGSVVVYGLVAACSAASEQLESRARGDGGGGTDDPAEGGGGSLLDAIADALTDPVKDAAADPPTSGTRLKAEYMRGDDGSRAFHQWFDVERQEACSYLTDRNGTMRCVGVDRVAVHLPDTWFGSTVTDCTDRSEGRVFTVPRGVPAPKYATVLGATGNTVWTVAPYVGQVRFLQVGVCASMDQDPARQYFSLVSEVQPTVFAKGTLERDP